MRKKAYLLLILFMIISVLSVGCINSNNTQKLTENESTIYIASVGGINESFTLWEHEPGCCKEIAFYMREPDGAVTIQSVEVVQSRIYRDATWLEARIVVTDKSGMHLPYREGWTQKELLNWNSQAIYNFHVPKDTVIRPYGSPGNRRSDSSDDDFAAYYVTYMSPISPLSPIHITSSNSWSNY